MSPSHTTMFDFLGEAGWLTGADAAPFHRDWLDRYGEIPLGVARPKSTAEVAAVVEACRRAGLSVVPQGGNTSLCGGAVAHSRDAVILSLSRMTEIEAPDQQSGSVTVEAGAVLAALHTALAPHHLIFPMHLGSEGSARIGGLIATNAGGNQAFRHGMMQDLVLGLEVVMGDGRVWNGLRAVQKDNAGYQLRKLFCGAEGTLGIVTRAVLKVLPAPRQHATAFLAAPSYEAAVAFGADLRHEAGEFLTGLEFMSDLGLDLALTHVPGLALPLGERAPVYLVVELACVSERVPLDDILAAALERGVEQGVISDGTLAMSDRHRAEFWRLREEQPEGQRLEGAQLKHDISVPPGKIAEFIAEARHICERIMPGARINPFGHLGDGNIHYNLSPPKGQVGFGGKAADLGRELAALATRLGGSFAAEHGLGRSKIALADALREPLERELMSRLKTAFEPDGLLNPGVIVGADGPKKKFPNNGIS